MREFVVWKAIDTFLNEGAYIIDGSCPPGGSDFSSNRCCLTHPITSKQDEPDFMCHDNTVLLLIECKPTWAGLCNPNRGRNNESDIDKLRRLKACFLNGDYDEQLSENYGLSRPQFELRIAVAYAAKRIGAKRHFDDIDEFVVLDGGRVKPLTNLA